MTLIFTKEEKDHIKMLIKIFGAKFIYIEGVRYAV